MEEYNVVEISGKHGVVRLHIPNREVTQVDIDELYRIVAEVAINICQEKKMKPAEK